MSSPVPPDPYAALGVEPSADANTIKTAYRKLALKCHPDRIQDEVEKERGKTEFQNIVQAWELLSDPARKSRYDERLRRIEEMKKMQRDPPRPSVYSTRTTSAVPMVRREFRRDGNYYEERAPPPDFYDSRDRYDEPIPRANARKHESFERRSSTAKTYEKREKPHSKWDGPVDNLSFKMAFNLKTRAAAAKDRVRENHAQKTELRDREKRRDRAEKTSHRSAYVESMSSESDSDTVVPPSKTSPRPTRGQRSRVGESEPIRSRAPPSRRNYSTDEEEHEVQTGKWERHHQNTREYIAESQKRPTLSRTGSDAYHYWQGDAPGTRRSGSDSDKRPSSSRRTTADESRSRPSMPVHSSAPSNLRPHIVEREPPREPQRSKTSMPPERPHRAPVPNLARSQTMPVPKLAKKDSTAPSRGSNLKTTELHDSGYSSNSNPNTLEMREESPPPAPSVRESGRRVKPTTTTKYTIVDPDEDEEPQGRPGRYTRPIYNDEDTRSRRARSPEPERRDREQDRPRERVGKPRLDRLDTNPRARYEGGRREDFGRYESQSPRGSPSVSRPGKLFHELSPERSGPGVRYDPTRIQTSAYKSPQFTEHRNASSTDEEYSGSKFRDGYTTSRRPSIRV